MAISAAIKFVQGATVGTPGVAIQGVVGQQLVASNGNDTDVVRWTWEWRTVAPTSAIHIGIAQDGSTSTFSSLPDVAGGYLLRLTVTDIYGNTAVDERVFQVPDVSGRRIPPFGATARSYNIAGQLQGWAPDIDAWLLLAGTGGGGASAPLTLTGSNDTPQLVVKGWTTQTTALQQWQNSGAVTVASVSNTGILSASGIDTTAAGALTVGTITATSVSIGKAGASTSIGGNLSVVGPSILGSSLDSNTGLVLTIGPSTAASVTIGAAAIPTTVKGTLSVTGVSTLTGLLTANGGVTVIGTLNVSTIDTAAAGVLTIGASVATGIHIGAVAATVTVGGALTAGGLLSANNGLTVSGTIQASAIDTAAAGAMTIAAATATSVTIGKVGVTVTVPGTLYAATIDRAVAATLFIGVNNATSIQLGQVGIPTLVSGALQVSALDTAAAGAMTIAAATATSLALGSGTCATTVGGTLTVTGKLSLAAASGDYVAFGTAPSVTGVFRLTNAATVTSRNGSNNGDVTMFYVNSANTVWIGDGANSSVVGLQSNTGFVWYQNGTARLNMTSSGLALICAGQTFHQAFVSGVSQNAAASDVATTAFTVAAMGAWSSAVTNVNGGTALVQGGAAKTNGTTGLRGGVRLQLGLDTAETMAEVAEVVVGQRVVSLCQIGSGVTSTQMPASTGDGVVYLANRNVVPAANAVGGGILYAESGALKWRGSSGTVTTVAVA